MDTKPAEVIKEFKIMADETSLSHFIKVKNAREFCYWVMSADVIEKFIGKRVDMAEALEDYPPLGEE